MKGGHNIMLDELQSLLQDGQEKENENGLDEPPEGKKSIVGRS